MTRYLELVVNTNPVARRELDELKDTIETLRLENQVLRSVAQIARVKRTAANVLLEDQLKKNSPLPLNLIEDEI